MCHLRTLHQILYFSHYKVRLELLTLYLCISDLAERSKALDIRLIDWCCSASNVWARIPSSESKTCQRKNIYFDKSGKRKERRDCSYNKQYDICLLNMSPFYQIGWKTKYHTVVAIPKSNIKIVERCKIPNTYIHGH